MPTSLSLSRVAALAALSLAAACTAQAPDEPVSDGVSVHIKALVACGEANPADPFKDIGKMDLIVHDEEGKRLEINGKKAHRITMTGSKSYDVAGVPAGPGRSITLLGYS